MRFDVFRVDGIIINIYFLFVKAIDKKKCQYTGKTVAIYERTQAGFEAINMQHIPRI